MPSKKEVVVRYTDDGKVVFDQLHGNRATNNHPFEETAIDLSAHESADELLRFARPARNEEDEPYTGICADLLKGGRAS